MTDKEEKSELPAPSPKGDGALRQKSKLFPIESISQNIPAEEMLNDLQEQLNALALPKSTFDELNAPTKSQRDIRERLKGLALPKSALDQFNAEMKPQRDLQAQLKGLALPKSAFDQFNAATKSERNIQKQLTALAPPKNPFTKLESAMKPQKIFQEQLTEIKEPSKLGKLIRKRRGINGMNQQQLADLAGVGRRFLSELENGKQSLEFGKVLRVASAIGIDLLAKQR